MLRPLKLVNLQVWTRLVYAKTITNWDITVMIMSNYYQVKVYNTLQYHIGKYELHAKNYKKFLMSIHY